jgi:hypothetical protein
MGFATDEEWDSDAGTYTGDEWWSCATKTGTFEARGRGRGSTEGAYEGTAKTVAEVKNGWEHSEGGTDMIGKYTGVGDESESDDRYIGYPSFTDGTDTYTRSAEKDANGYYTYGDISYDNTNSVWIIGTYDSESGWWEGDEPDVDASVTFAFTKPEGSEIEDEDDKTITFVEYLGNYENLDTRICNVGMWQ